MKLVLSGIGNDKESDVSECYAMNIKPERRYEE